MIFERSKKYPNRGPISIEAGVLINPKRLFSIETNFIDFPELPAPVSPPIDHIRLYAVADADFTVLETVTDLGIVNRINQDNFRVVRNTSGAPVAKGKAIRFTGSTGNKPNFSLANAALEATMPAIGLTTATVANNAFGEVMILGRMTGVKTNYTTPSVQAPSADWTEGDQLYVSTTDGELTNGRPVHPNLAQWVATIEMVHATNGIILVNIEAFIGIEDGTNRNSFTIGDTGAGDKSIIFNGTNDSTFKWDSTASKFYLTTGNLYLSAGTISCSTLTDGYIPKHTSDAVGLANSILFEGTTGIGVGMAIPTAVLHLKAGTSTASTAPLKFTVAGAALLTAPEVGVLEPFSDDLWYTISTGTARKSVVLTDGFVLTATRVPFATTNGRLTDIAGFTFITDTLTSPKIVSTGAFGCNAAAAQTAYPCAAWDEPGAGAFGVDSAAHMAALVELVKDIQAALIADGIMAAV